jgi:hypothetical protein
MVTLGQNPEENVELTGRPRCRWGNNIRMCLKEIICELLDYTHVGQKRGQCWALENTTTNIWGP